jgi:hypothetical protein
VRDRELRLSGVGGRRHAGLGRCTPLKRDHFTDYTFLSLTLPFPHRCTQMSPFFFSPGWIAPIATLIAGYIDLDRPSTPMPLPKKIASDSNFSLASPSSPTGELPRSISMLGNQDSPASGSPAGHTDPADVFNPLFPPTAPKTSNMDPLGRSQPAAFPSYLKIPTLIPSQYASPTTTTPSSPAIPDYQDWSASSTSSQATPQQSTFPTKLGGGGTAAAAILNTEEIVIKPGGASIASTPTERSPETPAEWAEAMDVRGSREGSEEAGSSSIEGGNGEHSRTPTPTPGNVHGAKALTPTGEIPPAMSTLSSALDSSKMEASWASSSSRRGGLKVYTGGESGANTPGLPIGLTMGPSSALIPQKIPAFNADRPDESSAISAAPLTKATNNLSLTTPQASARNKLTPTQSKPHSNATTPTTALSQVPLMPITVKWRGGGKEVFVTGTFANEWRSKILLKRVAGSGKRAEYSCVLHLAPGTHRLKFIVDDRWRVSRDLSTASDGEGNLTNYIEVAHIGPAHPGPLSAPGEDLLLPEDEEEKRKKGSVAPSNLAAHKATLDLIEEARRAEALRRGDLLDVFGNEKVHKEETWTQEIPESIIKAQLAEEAFRAEQEERKADPKHSRRDSAMSASNVPVPPTLPRQLEKVILNSSPAAVAGAVDDTSVLPAPNHAVLHHLTASAIKSGVVATGCTMRYRKKVSFTSMSRESTLIFSFLHLQYITTIYYRAAN